jgi:hypothetical protein
VGLVVACCPRLLRQLAAWRCVAAVVEECHVRCDMSTCTLTPPPRPCAFVPQLAAWRCVAAVGGVRLAVAVNRPPVALRGGRWHRFQAGTVCASIAAGMYVGAPHMATVSHSPSLAPASASGCRTRPSTVVCLIQWQWPWLSNSRQVLSVLLLLSSLLKSFPVFFVLSSFSPLSSTLLLFLAAGRGRSRRRRCVPQQPL